MEKTNLYTLHSMYSAVSTAISLGDTFKPHWAYYLNANKVQLDTNASPSRKVYICIADYGIESVDAE